VDPTGKGGHGRLLLWVVCRAAMGPMMSVTGSACQGGGPRLRSLRTLTENVPARTALYVLGLSSPLNVVSCLCRSLAAGSARHISADMHGVCWLTPYGPSLFARCFAGLKNMQSAGVACMLMKALDLAVNSKSCW
jgi:hypothetical protein